VALGATGSSGLLLVPAGGAFAGGVWLARRAQMDRAAGDFEDCKRVLQGAARLIQSQGTLEDARLASILMMDPQEVTRHVDFGMSRGYLPTDPSKGMPSPGMGHLLVYLSPTPLGLKWFNKPTLRIGFDIFSRSYGCHLITLEPGPKSVKVEVRYRSRHRTVTRSSSTSVYVREGEISGLYFTPSPLGPMGSGPLRPLGVGKREPPRA